MKVKALGILISLALCLSLVAALASPYPSSVKANGVVQTWHVATGGSNIIGDGSEGNPWLTIQYAIDQANAGDTIIVHPGEYVAGNQVGKSGLTIQSSDGSGVTTVHGSAVDGFDVWEPGVVIDGFTITNCYRGIWLAGLESGDDCLIKNNDIQYNVTGILVDTSNNIISHNTISYNNEQPPDFSGIHLTGDATNNLIINNTIEYNDHGIWIDGHNNKVLGNNIVNNGVIDSGVHLTMDAYGNEIHLNNIFGNAGFGVFIETIDWPPYTVNATNNWWGDVSGPYHDFNNPDGTGDAISDAVIYYPWVGAPLDLPAAHYEYLLTGYHVVDASGEADTKVTLTISTEKSETGIVIAKYESQPFPTEPFPDTALGKYVDVLVTNPGAVVWPIHVELSYTHTELAAAGIDENTLGLYYYQPENTFHRCSDTGVNTSTNIIWANVTEQEAGYLIGTPFGAGGHLPHPQTIPTLSQWGIMAAAILFVGSLTWTVRRRFAVAKSVR